MVQFRDFGNGIFLVDTHYLGQPEFAGCYIMESRGEVAVIESNTNHGISYILKTLQALDYKTSQVKYVILSHIHLDHAGGAGLLMQKFPEATLLLHSRGVRHMVDPQKLITSVMQVYGEEQYRVMYGDIQPVPETRIQPAGEGDEILLGRRALKIFDAPGHAKHHIFIYDALSGSVFSGDSFGIGYPKFSFGDSRLLFPSTSPTQFDPKAAMETYQKIMLLNPRQILLTHFGTFDQIDNGFKQLSSWIDYSVNIAGAHYEDGFRGEELTGRLVSDLWVKMNDDVVSLRESELTPEEREFLKIDVEINAQGLAHYIETLSPGDKS